MPRPAPVRRLALALLACSTAACASGGSFYSGGFPGSFEHQTSREENHALQLAPGERLTLDGVSGDIRVRTSDDGSASLSVRICAPGRTQSEAEQVLARYSVEIVRGSGGTTVRLIGEPLELHQGSVTARITADADFSASVPAGTAVTASTSTGDIRATGALGACALETDYGDVEVADARGAVSAKSGLGDVRALRLEGGPIDLRSGYGDVRLESATAERVACTTGAGDIDVEDARAAAFALSTDYGDVRGLRLAGALQARSGSGDLSFTELEGSLEAESAYGRIEARGALTGLRAETGSGDVRVRALAGSRVAKAWSLRSSYGSVSLWVPEDFGCELSATTGYGSVETDFAILLEAGRRKNERSLAGQVGAGGGSVELSSGSGDLALKKL